MSHTTEITSPSVFLSAALLSALPSLFLFFCEALLSCEIMLGENVRGPVSSSRQARPRYVSKSMEHMSSRPRYSSMAGMAFTPFSGVEPCAALPVDITVPEAASYVRCRADSLSASRGAFASHFAHTMLEAVPPERPEKPTGEGAAVGTEAEGTEAVGTEEELEDVPADVPEGMPKDAAEGTAKCAAICRMPFSAYITGKSASGENPSSGMWACVV